MLNKFELDTVDNLLSNGILNICTKVENLLKIIHKDKKLIKKRNPILNLLISNIEFLISARLTSSIE
tara:strand:+ start:75 stop:275 length:201 start_codon:yes stop_codon:yes gene_type:complete